MFSVEDLLVSHGYKLSKNPNNSYENKGDGYQNESTEWRAGYGTLNGFPTNSGAPTYKKKTAIKSYLKDNESWLANQGRQLGPSYHTDVESLASSYASEGG